MKKLSNVLVSSLLGLSIFSVSALPAPVVDNVGVAKVEASTQTKKPVSKKYEVATNFDKIKVVGEYKGVKIYGYGTLDYEIITKLLDADISGKSVTIKLSEDASKEFVKNYKEKVSSGYNKITNKFMIDWTKDNLARARLLDVTEFNPFVLKFNKYNISIENKKGKNYVTLVLKYNYVPDQKNYFDLIKKEIDNVLSKIKDQNPENDFEKLYYVYSYLGTKKYNLVYGDKGNISDNYSRSIHSLVLHNEGVCEAYAKLFLLLMRELGVESYLISSQADLHMGVLAYLDGKLYYIDPTETAFSYTRNVVEGEYDRVLSPVLNKTFYGGKSMKNGNLPDMGFGKKTHIYGLFGFDLEKVGDHDDVQTWEDIPLTRGTHEYSFDKFTKYDIFYEGDVYLDFPEWYN